VGRLRGPEGLVLDQARGRLYIADAGGRAVRRLDLASGQLVTIAGPVAKLGQPRGLALDGAGHLYVADALDETVRRLDVASGTLSPFAGTTGQLGGADGNAAQARLSGPAALTLAAGKLVVADAFTVRTVDLATAVTRTLAGRTAQAGSADGAQGALFRGPHGLAFDTRGRLYVADAASSTVRRIDPATGKVETLAGAAGKTGAIDGVGPAARFGRPLALAVDGDSLYVADPWEHDIRRVDLASGAVTTLGGSSARFCGPIALALDGAGHLFAADHPYQDESDEEEGEGDGDEKLEALLGRDRPGCSAIRRIDLATGAVATVAGSDTGQNERDGAALDSRFEAPAGLACDGRNLYIADRGGATLRRLDLAKGTVDTLAGKAGARGGADGVGSDARFDGPEGLALDGVGGLLVADGAGSTVRRLDLASRALTTLLGHHGQAGIALGAASGLNKPAGVALFGGRLFVSDAAENAILSATSPSR
jgi:DNA-binding beta-propeller fold protein YncE